MNLYLMRHGIAVTADDPGVDSDAARSLTPKGIKRMHRQARGMRRLGLSFDIVLTSPLVRARQTAAIIAETLRLEDRLEELAELAPQHSVDQLVTALVRFNDQEDLLVVGHEPLLSYAFSYFMGGKSQVNLTVDLKKGSIGCIGIDALPTREPGTLQWLLTPKQLRRLGEKKSKKVSAS